MRLLFLLLAFIPLSVSSQSGTQKKYLDSLKAQLSANKPDTVHIATLQKLVFGLATLDPESGIMYGNKAIELAKKQPNSKWLAASQANLAMSYAAKSDHSAAVALYNEALSLYKRDNNRSNQASIYTNLSLLYFNQSDYPTALRHAFSALTIYEDVKDHYKKALQLENIGHVYYEQKNYSQAEEYYKQVLQLYKSYGKPRDIARIKGNTARIYKEQRKFDLALELLAEALAENQKAGLDNAVQINLGNIGNIYAELGDFTKAISNHSRALAISEKLGMKMHLAINHGNLGGTYLKLAKATDDESAIDRAISELTKSLQLCREINLVAPQTEFSVDLSEAYKIKGEFKLAFETLSEGTKLRDSVFSTASKVEVAQLESQRAIALKNKDIIIKNNELKIAMLKRAGERNMFLAGIVFLIALVFFIVRYFVLRARSHKKDLDDMIQIQAHEIRGPVASILGLAQLLDASRLDDPENAELISGISTLAQDLDEVVIKFIKEAKR